MSRYHSYINSAKEILKQYKGKEPFASFLKKYFSSHKKFGSKDRRQVSHLCYCFFRLGKMKMALPQEERLLLGLFLCSDESNEILESLKPEWNATITNGVEEKCSMLNAQYSIADVFPWADELSAGIDHEKYCESFFVQPDLFLRLRPGKEHSVKNKLKTEGVAFEIISDNCLALPNASKIDSLIELNKEAVVQDRSSQKVGEMFAMVKPRPSDHWRAWDCCAASGGKSILLHDQFPEVNLTVSDVRESILANLRKRFHEAGIIKYNTIVADLAGPNFEFPISDFEFIMCDAPCSGSGTWSRTPEQLFYFETDKIAYYASLQEKIVSNVIPHLKSGGHLLYITCSVFKKENEDIIEFINQKFHLQLIKREVLKGYDKKADTMFAALLKKSL